MNNPAHFTTATQFYDRFQPANCYKGEGCYHDRNGNCPILLQIHLKGHHPDVLKSPTTFAHCTQRLGMAEGLRQQQAEQEKYQYALPIPTHQPGLFPLP